MKRAPITTFFCGKSNPNERQRDADVRRLQALLQVKRLDDETRERLNQMKARLDADSSVLLKTTERELVGKLVVEHGVDMQAGTIKSRVAGPLFTNLPTKPPRTK